MLHWFREFRELKERVDRLEEKPPVKTGKPTKEEQLMNMWEYDGRPQEGAHGD